MTHKATKVYTTPDESVTFVMLPFRNVLANVLVADMEKIIPRVSWTSEVHAFCLFVSATVDIAVTEEADEQAQLLAHYWTESQGLSTAERWQMFQQMVSDVMFGVWLDAYQATRNKKIPQAPDIIQEGEPADPNADGSGG